MKKYFTKVILPITLIAASLFYIKQAVSQTVLFTESFENGGSIPTGWSNDPVSGEPHQVTFVTTGNQGYPAAWITPYDGNYEVYYQSYVIPIGSTTRLSRTMNTSTVGYCDIEVDFAMYHDTADCPYLKGEIQVQYSIDNGTTWVNAGSKIGRCASSVGWAVHSIALPSNSEGIPNLRIAFLFISGYGNNMFMDLTHIKGRPLISLPYTEDWETASGSTPPAGWATTTSAGSAPTFPSTGTLPACLPYSGSRMVEYNSSTLTAGCWSELYLTSPIVTTGVPSVTIDFRWMTDPGNQSADDYLTVEWSTTFQGTKMETETFYRYSDSQGWTHQTVTLPGAAGNLPKVYLYLTFFSLHGNNCHLDLFRVYETPATPLPYTEDWETTMDQWNIPPVGWVTEGINTGVQDVYFVSAGFNPSSLPYSGNRMVEYPNYNQNENRLKQIAPVSTIGSSFVDVDFRWLTYPANGSHMDHVDLEYSTNLINWTSVGSFYLTGLTQDWTLQSVTLPAAAGNQPKLYIAFHFYPDDGYASHLDLVHITTGTEPSGGGAPGVVTNSADAITLNSAALNGIALANNTVAEVSFEWGLTPAYGNSVNAIPFTVSGHDSVHFAATLSGLTPNTTYHYRAKAVNANGTAYGNDRSFTTLAPTLSVTPPIRNVTAAAGSTSFSVSSNSTWTASSDQGWCTVTPSGTGNGTITANYILNNATSHTATVTVTAGGSVTRQVTVIQAGTLNTTVNLVLLLEGLYDGAGLMRQAQGDAGSQYSSPVVDKFTVELHDGANYATLVHTAANISLNANGTATFTVPPALNGSYYLTIIHRNSLLTVTANPVSFASGTVVYNMTDQASKAYSGNLREMMDNYWSVYAGDINQDGYIDTADFSDVDNAAATFVTGYTVTDINGDGYTDTGDFSLLDNNSALFIMARTP